MKKSVKVSTVWAYRAVLAPSNDFYIKYWSAFWVCLIVCVLRLPTSPPTSCAPCSLDSPQSSKVFLSVVVPMSPPSNVVQTSVKGSDVVKGAGPLWGALAAAAGCWACC